MQNRSLGWLQAGASAEVASEIWANSGHMSNGSKGRAMGFKVLEGRSVAVEQHPHWRALGLLSAEAASEGPGHECRSFQWR